MKERIRQVIASARLIDDTFMSAIFRNPKCAQVLVDRILPEEHFVVEESQTQPEMKNLYGRSVRLDILVRDGNGRHCNIEIQRKAHGAVPQRARYNCALVDMNTFQRSENFSAMADTYVVFIVEDDVLRVGLPLIHVRRIIQETGTPFNDGTHILYVNAQNMEDTPLGRLMQDMYCRNVDGITDPTLREEVRYYKEDKGGHEFMCELVEKIYGEELAAKDRAHQKELAERDSIFKALVESMDTAHQEELAEKDSIFKALIEAKETAYQEELAAKETAYQEELAAKDTAHQEALAAKETAYQEELAELKETQFVSSVKAGLTKELIMQIMRITEEEYNEYLLKCAERINACVQ